MNESKREVAETGALFDNATRTYGAALNVKFDVQDAIQKEQNKLEVELEPKKILNIDDTIKYLYETPTELNKMVKYHYDKFAELDVKADAEPENQEKKLEAAMAEKEYTTYRAKIKAIKDQEAVDAALDAQYGEPANTKEEAADRKIEIPEKEVKEIEK
jgi:predicted porin